MIFWTAIIDGEVIGGANAVVLVNTAGEPAKIRFSFEIVCVATWVDGHHHIVRIAYGQNAQFIFGVETCLIQIPFFFVDEAAEHAVVLVVIAVPTADPTALDALDWLVGGLLPIAVKGGTSDRDE